MKKLWKKFLTINWKKNILLVWGFLALSFLGVYSYNEINTLTQTVSEGDVMTAEWYNAVNAKLSSEVSASSSSLWNCQTFQDPTDTYIFREICTRANQDLSWVCLRAVNISGMWYTVSAFSCKKSSWTAVYLEDWESLQDVEALLSANP